MGHSGRFSLGVLPTAVGASSPLEAVLLLRRTGALIASWSRNGTSTDVVSVMAATLYGSIETIVGALGGPAPATVFLETDLRRMLLSRHDAQNVLLLVAPRSVSRALLRREARRIGSALAAGRSAAEPVAAGTRATESFVAGPASALRR